MTQSQRPRPSFAVVVSFLALVVALSSSAYAVKGATVGSKQLRASAVTTEKIKDNAVDGAKLSESSLGQVPEAASAGKVESATLALQVDSATTANRANTVGSVTSATTAQSAVVAAGTGPGAVRGGDLGSVVTEQSTSGAPLMIGEPDAQTAECPAGTTVISGGGSYTGGFLLATSRRVNPNGWQVSGTSVSNGATLTVFAYCLAA